MGAKMGQENRVGVAMRRRCDLEAGPKGGTFRRRRVAMVVDETQAEWRCAAVMPGREFMVADDLSASGFETFCPHGVRVSFRARRAASVIGREARGYAERDYPVFGSYLFVGVRVGGDQGLTRHSHRHIVNILDTGHLVPREFIRAASGMWASGAWDDRVRLGRKFKKGQAVRVTAGAFLGLTGLVELLPRQTMAVIALTLFGRSVRVTVDNSNLELL